MAWSCSEWLEERSLANEAAQCDASPLLRNICVCVSMHEQAGGCGATYIWYGVIIQHSCLLLRQRWVGGGGDKARKREPKFKCVSQLGKLIYLCVCVSWVCDFIAFSKICSDQVHKS